MFTQNRKTEDIFVLTDDLRSLAPPVVREEWKQWMEKFGEERYEKISARPAYVKECVKMHGNKTEGSNANVDVGDVLFYRLKLKTKKQKTYSVYIEVYILTLITV